MNENDRAQALGNERVESLLWRFSLPAIVGMLVNALYNIVDRIFIGQIDPNAIGGVFVTFPISLVIMAFAMLFGIGGNSLSSIRLGQGRRDEAEHILGNAFTLMLLTSVVLMGVFYFTATPILLRLGASENQLPYALDYIRVILLGTPCFAVGFAMNHFIRGEGNPKMAMMTMLIGCLTNIVLDYLFVIRFGWGVAGAAWATVIGQTLSALWVLRYFTSKHSLLSLKRKKMVLHALVVKEITALGMAPFAMQTVSGFVISLLNRALNYYGGDPATSSMGVIHAISTLAFMPVFGMNQGVQPILGFNFGARNYKRMKRALFLAIRNATVYMSCAWLVIYLFPEYLMRVFVPNPDDLNQIRGILKTGLLMWHAFVPILGVQIIGANYFQATGKPRTGTFLSLTRQLIILAPALIILPRFFGLIGVWMSVMISDVCSTILSTSFLIYDLRQYPNEDKPDTTREKEEI